MKRHIQKIRQKSRLLGNQLMIVIKKIIQQVVLPGRNQKGNLLSTILLLFIELTTLLIQFPWDFSIDFIKRWKYYNRFNYLVKKSVLITGCFLFLLSSFEWCYGKESREACTIVQIEQQCDISATCVNVSDSKTLQKRICYYYQSTHELPTPDFRFYSPHVSPTSIYLIHCNFRI